MANRVANSERTSTIARILSGRSCCPVQSVPILCVLCDLCGWLTPELSAQLGCQPGSRGIDAGVDFFIGEGAVLGAELQGVGQADLLVRQRLPGIHVEQ